MKKQITVSVVFAAFIFTCSNVFAKSAELKPKIDHVLLFKNGVGYFESSVILPAKETTVIFGQMPIPSFGTFWVGYPKSVKVRGLFTKLEDTTETQPVFNVAQVLASNIGKKAVLTIAGDKSEKTVEGIISEVTKSLLSKPLNPYVMETRHPYGSGYNPSGYNPYYYQPQPEVVVLKTDGNTVTLNAASIVRADIAGEAVKTTVDVPVQKPVMRLELEKPAAGEKVGITYLCRGITWSPAYLIDISDAKTARFTASALVINEVADIENATVDLITGFPNMQFSDINNPMAMTQSLADFLKALQTGRSESTNRELGQQIMMANSQEAGGFSRMPVPSYSTAQGGTTAEDLFLYPAGKLSLRTGETAYIPLFTANVPYEHIYLWKIPDMIDQNSQYQGNSNRNTPEPAEEIWHCCRMTNTGKMPWTTAPTEFVNDGVFIGQDTCYYTPQGSQTDVRINKALNIVAEQAEVEIERKRNAANFYGYAYDLVKLKGELKLQSRTDKPVKIEITKELSGDTGEMLPQAKDVMTAKGLKSVNSRHILKWTIELKSGESRTIAYTYSAYIRY